jgi:hypothetical protein
VGARSPFRAHARAFACVGTAIAAVRPWPMAYGLNPKPHRRRH